MGLFRTGSPWDDENMWPGMVYFAVKTQAQSTVTTTSFLALPFAVPKPPLLTG